MTFKLGSTTINEIRLGSTEVKKAYLGSTVIHDTTGGGGGGGSLVDNVGDTYFHSGSESDTQTLYLEAAFIKQTDDVKQILYETSSRSRVELTDDNTVYVRTEKGTGAVTYEAATTETITVADGLTRLIVIIDMSVPSVSVTIDGVAATIDAPVNTDALDHSRANGTGWLANANGTDVADLHLQDMRVSFDAQSSYVFDIDAADGATSLNAGTQDGTATLTRSGTGFSDV